MGWNLDPPRVVASLHANLSESNPRLDSIMIASKRQPPKRQPIIALRPYFEIDGDLVWSVVAGDLPELKQRVEAILEER